jgi:ribosomal-protein-alanine N-acetyltransferase
MDRTADDGQHTTDLRFELVGKYDDIEDIVRLEAESFSNPWTREMLARELMESPVTRLHAARTAAGALVAFCLCWVVLDELHVNTIAVAPDRRRQGVARALMRHVLADAAQCGARRATLEVRRSNSAAIALYEGLGFAVCATRPRYYTHPEEDALILWREAAAPEP